MSDLTFQHSNIPSYFYTAKSLKGESKSGILEAKDKHQLAQILRQEGYILISADLDEREVGKKPPTTFQEKWWGALPFLEKVSLTEKTIFTRNLGVMIGAGISFPRALRTLALQTKSKKFRLALLDLVEEIVKGKSFSDSLSKYPDIFSELFQNMAKVGEEAGTLEEVLKILTRQLEREGELKSKIKGAMIYPAIIILTMIGIGILMMIMVVPKLAETFKELNIELPLTTQLIIGISFFLLEKWYLFLGMVLVLVFLFQATLKTKKGKKSFDNLTLKIPIISPIIKKTNSAYTVRTLGSLIASGVPIVRALEVTSRALGNFYFREAMEKTAEEVRKGAKLSESLRPYENIYSPLVIQMIEVGEETGQTSDILEKLAEFFEEEVTNATRNLAAVIEPVLMLIVGATVGFFAISMIQPMYSMLGAIK